jgi:hypothetical protein
LLSVPDVASNRFNKGLYNCRNAVCSLMIA